MNYVILMKVNNGRKNLLYDSWDIFLRKNSSSFYFIEKIWRRGKILILLFNIRIYFRSSGKRTSAKNVKPEIYDVLIPHSDLRPIIRNYMYVTVTFGALTGQHKITTSCAVVLKWTTSTYDDPLKPIFETRQCSPDFA